MPAGVVNELCCPSNNGVTGCGTVFKITPSGKLTTLYKFCSKPNCTDGASPEAGLVQATDGNFYGTTYVGGVGNEEYCPYHFAITCGTVFKITPSGELTTLHRFCRLPLCTDGAYPVASLIQATDGNLYGTASQGGPGGGGTIFRITLGGELTTLHAFSGFVPGPYATLLQGANGNLYGTTWFNGAIFEIRLEGQFKVLDSFSGDINAGLVEAASGEIYGLSNSGGAYSEGSIFDLGPLGGGMTTLYNFCAQSPCTNGANPEAGLIQATDRNLYGTTSAGGSNSGLCFFFGCGGTIFKMTTSGELTTLYSFCSQSNCTDGSNPFYGDGLIQDTNGTFYGATYWGGNNTSCDNGCGTIFSFSVGLGPFVAAQPTSGSVGTAINILGSNFTGATRVSFGGTKATFTVVSSSQITTTVPAGATSGEIEVTTPSGTLTSNPTFRVIP